MANSSTGLQLPSRQKYIINHLLSKFMGNPNVNSVYLFGSCAKGMATSDSDIDIFVVTNDKVYDDSQEVFDILYGSMDDIPLEHYVSCDILTATKEDFDFETTPLIKSVKREGIELYGIL